MFELRLQGRGGRNWGFVIEADFAVVGGKVLVVGYLAEDREPRRRERGREEKIKECSTMYQAAGVQGKPGSPRTLKDASWYSQKAHQTSRDADEEEDASTQKEKSERHKQISRVDQNMSKE